MATPNTAGTRDRIINAAIILFSDKGYSKVSVRDIAKAVGIKAASLYNHFNSKEEILHSLYDYYIENQNKIRPNIDNLIKQVESLHPFEVLEKIYFRYADDIKENMDRISIIGFMEWRTDKKSEEFIKKCLLDLVDDLVRPLLERMLELGKIEALDIDAFVCLVSNITFGYVLRNYSAYPVSTGRWVSALQLVLSLVKPVE
jgi:AcrR family transcriptional regulator